jgi:hypothetical protein
MTTVTLAENKMTIQTDNGGERELTTEERLEAANVRIKELEEALRKEIEFKKASQLPESVKAPNPAGIWIKASNVLPLFVALRKAVDHANREPKWEVEKQQARKVLIEFEANSGEVKGAYLEQ